MTRLATLLLLPLLAAGCASSDPLRLIPATDRSMLEAEARLGTGGSAGRPISVEQMLASARASGGAAPGRMPEPLVLRYAQGAVQPDPAQRMAIEGFATRAAGAPRVVVVGRRATSLAGPDAMLGQRRAVAVARLLEDRFGDVEIRFEPTAAADEIILLGGAPSR
jgi:hypothetical protein